MSWTARFGLCAWLALVVANATSLEDALELVTKNVTGQFGTNFTLIEALVCKEDLCASKATETMKLLSDAHYMRAVYGYGIRTSPNVEARVNLSSMEMKLIRHEEPFIEDNPGAHWPPVSGLTFEAAFARIRSEMDVTIQQATWRRPVHPCTSEDIFQFELIPDVGDPRILSVGVSSGKLCNGFITEKVNQPMCPEPQCFAEIIV